MAIVVIGGHSKRIGKTSAVCGLIAALRERRWTAIKISPHAYDFGISEESDPAAGTDSSRYLAAGAARALWVRTGEAQLAEAMPQIRAVIETAKNVILESNSVLEFLQPDIFALVLDPQVPDFKPSALRYLERADAILTCSGTGVEPNWSGVSLAAIDHIPKFPIGPPNYVSTEFVSFITEKLKRAGS